MGMSVWKTVYRFTLLTLVVIVALAQAQVYRQRVRGEDGCPEPGFFRNGNDCQKFYRCAELPSEEGNVVQRYDFDCPPGTIFDEAISTCNHAYAVENVKPECHAAVDATLREIRERPDNSEQPNQGLYVPYKSSRPAQNNNNIYQNKKVYQNQPATIPQFVYQQPGQQQVYHQAPAPLVYQPQTLQQQQRPQQFIYQTQPQLQYQQAVYTTAGQPQPYVLGQQGQVTLQYLKK